MKYTLNIAISVLLTIGLILPFTTSMSLAQAVPLSTTLSVEQAQRITSLVDNTCDKIEKLDRESFGEKLESIILQMMGDIGSLAQETEEWAEILSNPSQALWIVDIINSKMKMPRSLIALMLNTPGSNAWLKDYLRHCYRECVTLEGFLAMLPAHKEASRYLPMARRILDLGISPNARDEQHMHYSDQTALHVTSLWGRKDFAALLLEYNAQVDSRDARGRTPLMIASNNSHMTQHDGHVQVVKLLLAHKADVNASSKQGYTALMDADNKEIVELLLAAGADVNAKTKDGWSALRSAASRHDNDILKLLIEHKADLNDSSWHGQTVLMMIIGDWYRENNLETIKLLLDAGADVNIRSEDGETALGIATRSMGDSESERGKELIRLLQSAGAIE